MGETESTKSIITSRGGLIALLPLLGLLVLCLLYSFLFTNKEVPISSLLIIAIVFALILTKNPKSIRGRLQILSNGVVNPDYISMIWIFILAGVFSSTSKDIGAVEVLAKLAISIFPGKFLLCGVFLSSCILSLVSGTSLGTVITLMPVISSLSTSTGIDIAIAAAAVSSGSFFGDNLSIISDTSIAAVKTLECSSQKKFLDNLRISIPAVLLTLIVYYIICPSVSSFDSPSISKTFFLIIPFIIVLVLSVIGLNVLTVLFIGICLNFLIGITTNAIGLEGFLVSSAAGAGDMGGLIVITFLCFGLLAIIKHNGGIQFIVQCLDSFKNKKWSEFSAALLVSLVNVCTINNTVAILSIGPVAKEIASRQRIRNYRMASIIDIFACVTQGLLPFSAQVLYASKASEQSVMRIILNSYFLFFLVVAAANAIISTKIYVKDSSYDIT